MRLQIIAAALALASAAQASFTFGTTASGTLAYNQFNTFIYMSNGFNDQLPAWIWSTGGFEFTVPQDDVINSLTVPLRSFEDAQTTFTLYTGTAHPETETVLEASSQTVPVNGGLGYNLFTFNFAGTTVLHPGQNYFLIGTIPQSTTTNYQIDWAGSSPGSSVPFFYGQTWLTGQFQQNGFLGWNTVTFSNGPAWQINADQAPAPEPAAFALAGAGLVAMGLIRLRRRAT